VPMPIKATRQSTVPCSTSKAGKERGRAMSAHNRGHRGAAAGLQRQSRWVRSKAWIWDFSSHAQDQRFVGWIQIEPDDVVSFLHKNACREKV